MIPVVGKGNSALPFVLSFPILRKNALHESDKLISNIIIANSFLALIYCKQAP